MLTSLGAIASAPTEATSVSSKIGVHCRPPFVLFQMPPEAAPA